ncbi:uncharacterized protein FIESC28_11379 [Fusarium coffeatum]|uniref:Uncharacterized protein n=1 Tax=Fusarium coffeatum TaxID=231269 RepID=A0A366QK74_9HYPO|nr:uncharacterized protein FIESC28_11379 [Fusarium coffeatum]RBR05329.1 hypothetical protein FIESC28_11379 [Fusarium coffeatum]
MKFSVFVPEWCLRKTSGRSLAWSTALLESSKISAEIRIDLVLTLADSEVSKIAPIFRSKRQYIVGSNPCTRKEFLLTVAYAIIVHESQGTAFDQAVADISRKDFTSGFLLHASRHQGIFETAFDLSDIASAIDVERGPLKVRKSQPPTAANEPNPNRDTG